MEDLTYIKVTAKRSSRAKIFKKGDVGYGSLTEEDLKATKVEPTKITIQWENGNKNEVKWPLVKTWYKFRNIKKLPNNMNDFIGKT